MSIDKRNLAVYLDELDDDPIRACEIARSIGLERVCLRRVWSVNISKATDDACKQLLGAIRKAKLSVLTVCTDDARQPAENLTFDQNIRRSLLIASYFKAKYFRPHIGLNTPRLPGQEEMILERVNEWMDAIGGECTRSAMVPLLEIDPDGQVSEPADVAAILERQPVWKVLYDPSLLIARRNQNPLTRYWYLLRSRVAVVDLHDFKQGVGFVPAGAGDCFFPETMRDCVANGYSGWFVVEPGVSRRSHPSANRKEIAQAVIGNFIKMAVEAQQKVSSWVAPQGPEKRGASHGKKRP